MVLGERMRAKAWETVPSIDYTSCLLKCCSDVCLFINTHVCKGLTEACHSPDIVCVRPPVCDSSQTQGSLSVTAGAVGSFSTGFRMVINSSRSMLVDTYLCIY